MAQCGKGEVQAAYIAAAADEDGVGNCGRSNLLGARSGHAVEHGHGEGRAVGHGGGDWGASDSGEEPGEGINGALPRLGKQLVEQIECVLGVKVSRAETLSDEALQLAGRAVFVPPTPLPNRPAVGNAFGSTGAPCRRVGARPKR